MPFVDYATCNTLLERIINVNKKHTATAELIIARANHRNIGFMLKNIVRWFYTGKNCILINDSIKQLIERVSPHGIFIDISENTQTFFENNFDKFKATLS